MQETDEWQGTPSQLLSALEQKAASLRLNTAARTWPKAANAVTRRMNEIRANLEQAGIEVDSGKSGRRSITLKKSCANTVQTAQTVQVLQANDLETDSMRTVRPEDENIVQMPPGSNPIHNNTLDSKDGLDGISATSYDDDQAAEQH